MRHPLLRILVALLIGVVTPLCCCQAMAMVGAVCDGRHERVATAKSCCHGCEGDSAPVDHQEPTPENGQSVPDECPSCPSCQGTSSGSGIKAEIKLPAFEQHWNALATMALAVLWNLPPLDSHKAPSLLDGAEEPLFLRANRDALRWHCALVM